MKETHQDSGIDKTALRKERYTPESKEVKKEEVFEAAKQVAEGYEMAASNLQELSERVSSPVSENLNKVLLGIEKMEINHPLAMMDGAIKYRNDAAEMQSHAKSLESAAKRAERVLRLSEIMTRATEREEGKVASGGAYVTENGIHLAGTSPEDTPQQQSARMQEVCVAIAAIQHITGERETKDSDKVFLGADLHEVKLSIVSTIEEQLSENPRAAAVTVPLGMDTAVVVRKLRHDGPLEGSYKYSYDFSVISTITKAERDKRIQHQNRLRENRLEDPAWIDDPVSDSEEVAAKL